MQIEIEYSGEWANLTIRKLRLNRLELIERRQEHITRLIDPLLQLYGKTADTDLRAEIAADLEALAQPDREFSSMVMHIMRQCGEFG